MSSLFISPHNDDETLFGAFTLCREVADIQVIVIFDGYVQASRGEPVTWQERREETVAALKELGMVKPPMFAGFRDDAPNWDAISTFIHVYANTQPPSSTVYIPWQEPRGHVQHNEVGRICENWIGDTQSVLMKHYTTYSTDGKTIGSTPVIPEPDWVTRKLRALACYRSQITVANCREHFMRGLHEYYA